MCSISAKRLILHPLRYLNSLTLFLIVFIFTQGTLSCRGRLILMADADGATKFADIENVEEGLESIDEKPVRLHFL